jgi:signal transduction histidine kinase
VPARTLIGFVAAVAAIVIAVAAYFLVVVDRDRKGADVSRRSESLLSMQRLDDALARAEGAQRGYLLTREARHLEAYRRAVADIHAELDGLKARAAVGPRDGLPSDALATLIEAKLSGLRRVLEVRDEDGLAKALRELRESDERWLTDTIEAVRAEMEAIERAELGEHRRAFSGRVALADAIFLGANLLLLVLVIAAGRGALAEMRRREERAQERLRMLELQERILGIVSHDLRTPLSAIQSGAALLTRAVLPPPQARTASLVYSSARRMERIIRDLLDFTRTRASKGIPLAIRATDAGEVCARVVEEASLTSREVPIVLHRDGDLSGEWDPDRLEQAIGNLVVNALRYAPRGTPVRIHAAAYGDLVRIDVENDGPPIPPDAVRSLFDPFQRSDGAPSGGAGLGLGLFIVRTIVEAHGGTVEAIAASAPPVTFTVQLPRAPPGRQRGSSTGSFWRPTRAERPPAEQSAR